MTLRHREHTHEIMLETDETGTTDEVFLVDGREVCGGYVTRTAAGELIVCLPESVCDED